MLSLFYYNLYAQFVIFLSEKHMNSIDRNNICLHVLTLHDYIHYQIFNTLILHLTFKHNISSFACSF